MLEALLLVLLLSPLLGAGINAWSWRRAGIAVPGSVGSLSVGVSFVAAVLLTVFQGTRPYVWEAFSWVQQGGLSVGMGFLWDPLSALMSLVITGVGFLIHVFSCAYMKLDKRPSKYFAYLNLFVFNMLLLVLADNLLLMFVGWEGVGLCSYLLIGFWFSDRAKAAAGLKAFLVNRVGDACFLLGVFLVFLSLGVLDFVSLKSLITGGVSSENWQWLAWAGLLLFMGATGKSAQLPLFVWLPDAMAGPTPVSALIHAATMVTAGVYMLARLSFMYMQLPWVMDVVAIVGAVTMLVGAFIALTQWDIKKILAYSTMSQLGYMFLACGVGAFGAGVFHLMTHAFFKALMFLGAGSVIHALSGEQDIRRMGGLSKALPGVYGCFFVGWLAIIGAPGLAGFFSKDEILFSAWASGSKGLWFLGLVGAGLTAFYMTRLMCFVFWGKSRLEDSVQIHKPTLLEHVPLMVLGLLAVGGGFLGVPHVLGEYMGHMPHLLHQWLGAALSNKELTASHTAELVLMFLSVALVFMVLLGARSCYLKRPQNIKHFVQMPWVRPLYTASTKGLFWDWCYGRYVVQGFLDLSRALWVHLDVGCIDRLVDGLGAFVLSAGRAIKKLQNGRVQHYATYISVALALGLFLVFL